MTTTGLEITEAMIDLGADAIEWRLPMVSTNQRRRKAARLISNDVLVAALHPPGDLDGAQEADVSISQ